MGGDEPAHTLIRTALASGRSVATANKHVVAHYGAELEALARKTGATFRFEAAVGGGIPLLGPIAQDLAANRIARVRGIVNGTTNYMLTAMAREGRQYADILKEAQAKGYAEADPTADVEGLDAVNKLSHHPRSARLRRLISADAVSNRLRARARQAASRHHRRDRGRRDRDGRRGPNAAPDRHDTPGRGAVEASVVPRRSPSPTRRSAAATACSTASRSMRSRWAAWRSRVRAQAVRRRARRCSATSFHRARRGLHLVRRGSRGQRRRRGAPGRGRARHRPVGRVLSGGD
ncbi:MAG: hypothetical protein U0838_10535 [Chloroflexota bacterium]